MHRRFFSLTVRPSVHLMIAGFFALVLLAGDCAVIPSRRYDTDNLVAAAVIVCLIIFFLFLAWRGTKKSNS